MRTANCQRRSVYERVVPGSLGGYAFAIVCVAVASFLELGLKAFEDDIVPFTPFYPAVLFAALIGGSGPGVVATLLGGLICWWAFIPPKFTFDPMSRGHLISLAMYFCAAMFLVWGAERFRKLSQRVRREEQLRKLVVQELAHRLKNKVATVQAIVALELRGHPSLRDRIAGRLRAFSAADDLIDRGEGTGASIRDLVCAALGPYSTTRASIDGPAVHLAPQPALMMALILHELATNAAKYGSLSVPTGGVSIAWKPVGETLTIEWCEHGGPAISPPTHRGFGSCLLSRALELLHGTVETAYPRTGMICKITLRIQERTPRTRQAGGRQFALRWMARL